MTLSGCFLFTEGTMHLYSYPRDIPLHTERISIEHPALLLTMKGVMFSRGSSTTVIPQRILQPHKHSIFNSSIDLRDHVTLKESETMGEDTSNRIDHTLKSSRLVSLDEHTSLGIRQ
jgi:hypothetical protein